MNHHEQEYQSFYKELRDANWLIVSKSGSTSEFKSGGFTGNTMDKPKKQNLQNHWVGKQSDTSKHKNEWGKERIEGS